MSERPTVRSTSEMNYAASLVPCAACGAHVTGRFVLDLYGDSRMWSLAGRCPRCNAPRHFDFFTDRDPMELPTFHRLHLGGSEPSRIIRPHQLLAEVERLEPELQVDPTELPAASWAAQSETADRAATTAVEVCKFLGPGDDAIQEPYLSDEDRALRGAHPERYTRAWLEALRERLIARVNRFAADAPRVWMLRSGNKLHVSEEIRGILNQLTEQCVPPLGDLLAYFAVRGDVHGDTVTLSEAGDVASMRAWEEPDRIAVQLTVRRARIADVEEATGMTRPASDGRRVAAKTVSDLPITFELEVQGDRVQRVTIHLPLGRGSARSVVPSPAPTMPRAVVQNRCARGGYLVDGSKPVSTDPSDFHLADLPLIGCNRLRCSRCNEFVREATGLGFAREEITEAELRALYETTDLASSALLRSGYRHWRVYLCRCSRRFETSQHSCDEIGLALAWRCHGHPPLTLPQYIDGVFVASQGELRDLALRALHDEAPPGARPEDTNRGAYVARLHARLEPADAAAVASVAFDCLADVEPRTRALALRFVHDRPNQEGRERLLELVDHRLDSFAGVPDPFATAPGDTTLEHTAWRVLGPLLATPGRARAIARTLVTEGAATPTLRAVVREFDRDWLDAYTKAEKEKVRPLADPRLQRALDDVDYREELARSDEPLGRFLRALGAFHYDRYDQIQYTDWNGAVVGGEQGELRRAAIPPTALPFAEIEPLLARGVRARVLVAQHPSTPKEVVAKLAEDADAAVRYAARQRQH